MSDSKSLRAKARERAGKYAAAADRSATHLQLARAELKAAQAAKAPAELIAQLQDIVDLEQLIFLQQTHLARSFDAVASGKRAFA